jgi:hypothetical protein
MNSIKIFLPPAARGALFVKTAPLDPPQKLLIALRAVGLLSFEG